MRRGLIEQARVRLAKSGGAFSSDYFEWTNGYLPSRGRQAFAVIKQGREWTFVHVPSGFGTPGLYARTLKGAAPVLIALADAESLDRPHSTAPGKRIGEPLSRDDLIAVLSRCDTSGLIAAPLAFTFGVRSSAPDNHPSPPSGASS
jgi:hypothetical protein